MKEFKTEATGNTVIINCAPWDSVQKLKHVIISEIKKTPIGIKLIGGDKTLFEKELDFTGILDFIKDTLINIDTSEAFDDAIFDCLQYCTYKKVYKIDKELFNNEAVPEARQDYYELVFACIEENLRPFVKSLISTWKTHIKDGKFIQQFGIM